MKTTAFKQLDWGSLSPLRMKSKTLADGIWAGGHRSARRGAGVEFGGHRAYVPGDDLRWLDRRALLRHGRLIVREFETETERSLRLVLDASPSMDFRGPNALGAKLAFGALIAAATGRVALSSADPVALDWIGGRDPRRLPAMGGGEAFDRLIHTLETIQVGDDISDDLAAVERPIASVARGARRGSAILIISDFIDLPEGALDAITSLSSGGRTVVCLQVLDRVEVDFPFDGPVRLVSSEGSRVVETDAGSVRDEYLRRLEALTAELRENLARRGGRLVRTATDEAPIGVVRRVLRAIEGRTA